jgi:hypothetical protein
MRVLSQSEIDAMLASLLSDASVLPGFQRDANSSELKEDEQGNN